MPHHYSCLNHSAAKPLESRTEIVQSLKDCYLKDKKVLEALSRLTSGVVFLLDYTTRQYLYMDISSKEILGHPCEEFLEGGLDYTLHHYWAQDLELYNKVILPERLKFLIGQEKDCTDEFRFTHTFRFRMKNGQCCNLIQHETIINLKETGFQGAVFGTISNIDHKGRPGIITHLIEKSNTQEKWVPVMNKYYCTDREEEFLSKRELELVRWISEGFTSKQIAEMLNISLHTVNTHRKNMLEKTNMQNMTELINFVRSRELF